MRLSFFEEKENVHKKYFILKPYQKKFILFNSKYWKNAYKSKSSRTFLVEGLLGGMPTHLFRLGCSAKAIERFMDVRPVVILQDPNDCNRKMFESFGIDEFVYLNEVKLNAYKVLLIFATMIRFLIKCDVNSLLNIRYKNICIGKLIYDDILHSNQDCYTVEKIQKGHIKLIISALVYVTKYETLIEQNNPDVVLLSHNEYIKFGTLAVAALCQNKKIITVNDIEVSQYGTPPEMYWHGRFNSNIVKILKNVDNEKLQIEGMNYLNERVYGSGGLFDTKKAFGDKKVYTRKELRELFSNNENNNVFIFMHVFSDAPHLSEMDMYKDYYDWIIDTVRVIRNIKNVNWYIKFHPSAYLYKETEKIREIFETDQSDTIFFVPDDFNAVSIRDVADAVVTCQGTVGIEAGCMGIPAIVTGKPFYAGFGFTLCPKSKKQYYKMLNKCSCIKKLSDEKIKSAMAVMGAFNRTKNIDTTILDDEVYEYAGYGKQVDFDRAYYRIVENLRDKSYEDILLYNKVKELLAGMKY